MIKKNHSACLCSRFGFLAECFVSFHMLQLSWKPFGIASETFGYKRLAGRTVSSLQFEQSVESDIRHNHTILSTIHRHCEIRMDKKSKSMNWIRWQFLYFIVDFVVYLQKHRNIRARDFCSWVKRRNSVERYAPLSCEKMNGKFYWSLNFSIDQSITAQGSSKDSSAPKEERKRLEFFNAQTGGKIGGMTLIYRK